MKSLLTIVILSLLMGLPFGLALAKETTTLEEATNRTHSDRNVVVFKDKKNGYICYYRKTADGISCVKDLNHMSSDWKTIN